MLGTRLGRGRGQPGESCLYFNQMAIFSLHMGSSVTFDRFFPPSPPKNGWVGSCWGRDWAAASDIGHGLDVGTGRAVCKDCFLVGDVAPGADREEIRLHACR